MVKQKLKGFVESFSSHIDPEKEEQLKCVKIETETKVRRILTLAKSKDKGNKDEKLRKRSELIELINDFHKQYESLYALYDNLRRDIRQNVCIIDDGDDGLHSSTSNSDSELFYSPSSSTPSIETLNTEDDDIKDILTSTSVVMEETISSSESLPSFSQVPEDSVEFIKDLGIQTEHMVKNRSDSIPKSIDYKGSNPEPYKPPRILGRIQCQTGPPLSYSDRMVEKLVIETVWLKELISKKDEELVSLNKKHQLQESERLTQIKGLEAQLDDLKQELEIFRMNKSGVIEKGNNKSSGTKEWNDELSKFEARILEVKSENQKKDDQLSFLVNEKGQNEIYMMSKIKDLSTKVNDLENELDSLHKDKTYLENQLYSKAQEHKQLTEDLNILQHKLNTSKNQNDKLELALERKSQDISECHNNINYLKDKVLQYEMIAKGEKEDFEEKMKSTSHDMQESMLKKEQLCEKIYELHATLTKREDDLSYLHNEYQVLAKEKNESLQTMNEMEKRILELVNKVSYQEKMMGSMEDEINKSRDENQQQIQRKVDEMIEEFRKPFEDNLRLLSRRIRVAEQLQTEVKEWYRKTIEPYVVENPNINIVRRDINVTSLTSNNDVFGSIDGVSLRFEECTANFMNRISKVSCELKFVKDWVMRKNKVILNIKDDRNSLLAQLDEKEGEILVFRERVWKYENRVRELENLMKERDEYTLGLKEEKMEAIRQLCVWIDYHRSRSDYYKKTLTDITVGCKRPTYRT